MTKLKSKDVKEVRLKLLAEQGYKCALCGNECTEEQAVLDHCHQGGHIRAVLHRGCNAAEGKILASLRRYGIKTPDGFLKALVQYHEHHSVNRTGLIHPLHKTPEEKKELAKKRRQRNVKNTPAHQGKEKAKTSARAKKGEVETES